MMDSLVAIAADHGGFSLKDDLIIRLGAVYSVLDLGANKFDATDDYPDYALAVAHTITSGTAARGILICGSGVGACIAANKIKGVRAGVCHDTYSAHQSVEHDNMNVLCIGARVIALELAVELINAFLSANFKATERYCRRLDKIAALERRACK
jgi:ribose 5-phosphate isomerase B